MPVEEHLAALASSLSIVPPAPITLEPGQSLTLGLSPDPGTLQVSELVSTTLDIKWITKQVRFQDAFFETDLEALDPTRILGGMPIISGGLTGLPGIPGDLGQLVGSIEIPSDLTIPVAVTVTWSITDEEDEPLTHGVDYFGPSELTSPALSLVFSPAVDELTSNYVPRFRVRRIRATVQLAAGDHTFERTIGPVEVLVAPIAVPKVLALFRHREYATTTTEHHPWPSSPAWESWVLLVVPTSSPISGVEELQTLLRTLGATLSSLNRIASFASFATGIGELASAVSAQMFVQLLKTDAIADLKSISFRGWDWDRGNLGPADHASALILVGPNGASVELNNGTDNGAGFGRFLVTVTGTPLGIAFVRDFARIPTPVTPPMPIPGGIGGTLEVTNAASGYVVDEARNVNSFDNEVSSLRFP
jgi:hypothetical protein